MAICEGSIPLPFASSKSQIRASLEPFAHATSKTEPFAPRNGAKSGAANRCPKTLLPFRRSRIQGRLVSPEIVVALFFKKRLGLICHGLPGVLRDDRRLRPGELSRNRAHGASRVGTARPRPSG